MYREFTSSPDVSQECVLQWNAPSFPCTRLTDLKLQFGLWPFRADFRTMVGGAWGGVAVRWIAGYAFHGCHSAAFMFEGVYPTTCVCVHCASGLALSRHDFAFKLVAQ